MVSHVHQASLFTRPVRLLMALGLAFASLLGLAPVPTQAASGGCVTTNGTVTCTFNFTGAAETWTVPAGVTEATFEVYGGQGGPSNGAPPGLGGSATATIGVTPGATYQINVGGQGAQAYFATGGFNGGGNGGGGTVAGGGGGGASDVRGGGFSLAERLIVAGGGGGGGGASPGGAGGVGGDVNGGNGGDSTFPDGLNSGGGRGGSQSSGGDGGFPSSSSENGAGGSEGQGGGGGRAFGANDGGGGGGGGGYYGGGGGGGGVQGGGGGGGGSGYGPAGVVFQSGVRAGDGSVIITYTEPVIFSSIAGTLGTNGWYTSDVNVTWSVTDAAVSSTNGCGPRSVTSDTIGVTFTCTVTSANGTSSQSVTIKRDTAMPTVSAAATSSPNANGWYNGDVTVAYICDDALSGIIGSDCSPPQTLSGEGVGISSTAQTITDRAGNTSAPSNIVTVRIDRTAPTIRSVAITDPNANGWYNGDVTVAYICDDALSGIIGSDCSPPQTLSGEGVGISSTAQTITDRAGNTSAPSNIVTVRIDRTAPSVTVTGVTNGAIYPLGSVPAAGCATNDGLSGVATQAALSITGGTSAGVGSFTATCAGASDNAGNTASTTVTYHVAYRWSGFFQPIDNLPTVNSAKAGQAIPVKFSLGGDYGLNIFAPGYPRVQVVSCTSSALTDEVEETVTSGGSSLQYDAVTGQYTYVWKTDKSWAGSCRQLVVRLVDGIDHIAQFKFR